jgi:hypothetical protein
MAAMVITMGMKITAIMITPRIPDPFRTRSEVCFAKIP